MSMVRFRLLASLQLLTTIINAQSYSSTFGAGVPFGRNASLFINASLTPQRSDNVSFPGFNWNIDPSSTNNITSTQNWTLQANTSIVQVDNAYPRENNSIAYTSFDLALPYASNPIQNDTDWRLCASQYTDVFPSNVTGNYKNEPGDCSTVLGDECLRDYRAELETRARQTRCPSPPFWRDIPSCYARMGSNFGTLTSEIMSSLPPNIEFRDGGYYNISTNGTRVRIDDRDSIRFLGLPSRQTISYYQSGNFAQNQSASVLRDQTAQMRMIILTFGPKANWWNTPPGQNVSNSISSGSSTGVDRAVGSRTRLICLRVDRSIAPLGNGASDRVRMESGWLVVIVVGMVVLVMGV